MRTSRKFAYGTTVAPEKTKAQIESLLSRYGANSFASGWNGTKAVLIFQAHGRRVKFELDLKNKEEREVMRLWRCLLLAIKAKLEVVESGIATFEEEFLAHIVLPDGETVGDWIQPQIQNVYETGKMPLMLGSGI